MRNQKISRLTLCGIYMAMSLIFLVIASFIPGVEMTVMALSSCVMAFTVIEGGIKFGLAHLAGVSVLGFVILPNKLVLIPYLIFFGIYPLIKFFAEKVSKPAIQILLKIIYFCVVVFAAYFLLFDIFFGNLNLPQWLPVVIVIPAAIVAMLVMDYILTAVINIYFKRIHSIVNKM